MFVTFHKGFSLVIMCLHVFWWQGHGVDNGCKNAHSLHNISLRISTSRDLISRLAYSRFPIGRHFADMAGGSRFLCQSSQASDYHESWEVYASQLKSGLGKFPSWVNTRVLRIDKFPTGFSILVSPHLCYPLTAKPFHRNGPKPIAYIRQLAGN